MAKKEDEPVWKKAFIEIALRAIRRLHIDYGMWGLGQEIDQVPDFGKLNQGPGIEIAYETAICAAISQEFINSRFTNGSYSGNIARHYEINREVKFTLPTWNKKTGERNTVAVDLLIDRFQVIDGKVHYFRYPAIIQAKRAHYYVPEISTGILNGVKKNWPGIKDDIENLKYLKRGKWLKETIAIDKYKGQLKGSFLYTLFWGVSNDGKGYLKEIEKEIGTEIVKPKNLEIRLMPLQWRKETQQVTKWFWLALLEINPYKRDPKTDNIKRNWFILENEKKQ